MRAIVTNRLTLEPQQAAHAQEMFVVLSDPAIYEYENEPPPSLAWLQSRFVRLESRRSPDGQQQWLNWVIRHSSSGLIGYVQATISPDNQASLAYVLASASWGQGFGFEAVEAILRELVEQYGIHTFSAVLREENFRSKKLLERLQFQVVSAELSDLGPIEQGEIVMQREISRG